MLGKQNQLGSYYQSRAEGSSLIKRLHMNQMFAWVGEGSWQRVQASTAHSDKLEREKFRECAAIWDFLFYWLTSSHLQSWMFLCEHKDAYGFVIFKGGKHVFQGNCIKFLHRISKMSWKLDFWFHLVQDFAKFNHLEFGCFPWICCELKLWQ